MDARTVLLAEMVREGERVLDHQLHALEQSDEKSAQMLRLGVASLAGALTLALFSAGGVSAPPLRFLLMMGSGVLANIVALGSFLDAYVGIWRRTEAHVGPSLHWIRARAGESDWALDRHLAQVVEALPSFHDHNVDRIGRLADARRRGILALLVGILAYALALSFIILE